jgi:hypothetical protein
LIFGIFVIARFGEAISLSASALRGDCFLFLRAHDVRGHADFSRPDGDPTPGDFISPQADGFSLPKTPGTLYYCEKGTPQNADKKSADHCAARPRRKGD